MYSGQSDLSQAGSGPQHSLLSSRTEADGADPLSPGKHSCLCLDTRGPGALRSPAKEDTEQGSQMCARKKSQDISKRHKSGAHMGPHTGPWPGWGWLGVQRQPRITVETPRNSHCELCRCLNAEITFQSYCVRVSLKTQTNTLLNSSNKPANPEMSQVPWGCHMIK